MSRCARCDKPVNMKRSGRKGRRVFCKIGCRRQYYAQALAIGLKALDEQLAADRAASAPDKGAPIPSGTPDGT